MAKSWIAGEQEALTARALLRGDLSFAQLFGLRVTELEASDREEVLVNLVTFFGEAQTMHDTWSILQAVREREQLGSTAMGRGVALPHCRSELVNIVTATCGLLRRPVEWGAPDGHAVDLVFLIISPARDPEQHLQAVRSVALASGKASAGPWRTASWRSIWRRWDRNPPRRRAGRTARRSRRARGRI